MPHNSQVIKTNQMQDEFLTRCVVDPLKRTVYLYSSDGNEKQVSCETVQEFMNVLDFVRATVDEDTLSYTNSL
jgi:hypothetical protein